MMFTTLSAKLADMKAKVLAGAAVACAALMLATPAAQAQRLAFGVTIRAPVYAAPAPAVLFAGPGYYDGVYIRDYNGWRAHYMSEHRFDRDRFDHRDFDGGRHFDRDHDRDSRYGRR